MRKPFGCSAQRILCCVMFLICIPRLNLLGQKPLPPCEACADWNAPQEPFKVHGNTYYVGPHGLSSILITSKAGDVLIDGGLPESAEQIRDHIRALGFRIEDVNLIVNSHVHFDHAGGIAKLQSWSHARVAASESSAAVMSKGGMGNDDPQYGILPAIAKVKRVERLRDGQTFQVGDIAITAHLTPGHTPGGTSWTWKSCEGGRCLDMVYADSLTPVSAPGFKFSSNSQTMKGYEKSFAFLEGVPCDILITTHPDVSGFWAKVERRGQGVTPDPMTESGACKTVAANAREQLRKRIQSEKSN